MHVIEVMSFSQTRVFLLPRRTGVVLFSRWLGLWADDARGLQGQLLPRRLWHSALLAFVMSRVPRHGTCQRVPKVVEKKPHLERKCLQGKRLRGGARSRPIDHGKTAYNLVY